MTGPVLITVSGRMYAGKDTLADGLVPLLPGVTHRFTVSDLIRAEAQPALDALWRLVDEEELFGMDLVQAQIEAVRAALNISVEAATDFVLVVTNDPAAPTSLHDRTDATRFILQRYGKDWVTENYWPDQALEHAREHLARGENVVMVGLRFMNEFVAFGAAGATRIGLVIDPRIQRDRAVGRDGLEPTAAALTHRGEIELVEAPFEIVIDSSFLTPAETLEVAVEKLRAHRVDLAAPKAA